MTHEPKEPNAQKRIIKSFELLHYWFRNQSPHHFKVEDKKASQLDEIFQSLGFFGPDSHVDPEKDSVHFGINVYREPGLYYQKGGLNIKNPADETIMDNPEIGIILNIKTNELDYFIWGGDITGGLIRSDVDNSPNKGKYIDLANCLVDITEQEITLA